MFHVGASRRKHYFGAIAPTWCQYFPIVALHKGYSQYEENNHPEG
jgi:hypothetical protein